MLVIRRLLRAPAFSVGVILTLGTALGAALSAFTLVERVMLRPLPVLEPERIVVVSEDDTRGAQRLASYPTFEDWRQTSRSFAGLVFARGETATLGGRGERERLIMGMVSPGIAATLGVRPLLGRTFAPEEESPAGAPVVLLTESVWTARFGRDPAIVGRVIVLDDQPTTVIGVLPEAQRYPEWAEVLVPLASRRAAMAGQGLWMQNRLLHADSRVIGRLAPGVTMAEAQRDLSAIQGRLAALHPDPAGAYPAVQLVPLRDAMLGNIRGPLTALGWAMALVLLLACANVGGLALLRVARRSREFGVRAALGSPRRRIMGDVVAEWLVLSALAGGVGALLAAGLIAVVRNSPSLGIPRRAELAVDGWLLLAGVGAAVGIGVLIGTIPALRAGQASIARLRSGRGSAGSGTDARWLRAAATVVQMALAVILLSGAGLLLKSFGQMRRVDPGYRPEDVLAIDIHPPARPYDDEEAARALYRRLVDAAAAIPGVRHAAFINHVPLGGAMPTRVLVPGVAPDPDGGDYALYKTASEGYAEALGLRLVRGRWFTREEVDAIGTGVVISEAVARRFWPDADPIGRSLTVYRSSQARPNYGAAAPATVVGVVGDVRHFGPSQPGAQEVYLPFTREAWGWGSIVVRSSLNRADVRRALEQALRAVEPELSFGGAGGAGFRVLAADLDTWYAPRRLAVQLASGLAALALLVASLGLYALSAYAVSQRTGEFGVRMALGASPGRVLQGVMGEGLRLVVLGGLLGVAGALALGRVLAAQLFDTSARDPLALTGAVLALAVVLCVALLVPARRAAGLGPSEALRAD